MGETETSGPVPACSMATHCSFIHPSSTVFYNLCLSRHFSTPYSVNVSDLYSGATNLLPNFLVQMVAALKSFPTHSGLPTTILYLFGVGEWYWLVSFKKNSFVSCSPQPHPNFLAQAVFPILLLNNSKPVFLSAQLSPPPHCPDALHQSPHCSHLLMWTPQTQPSCCLAHPSTLSKP